jgi:CBS domain-containing protein
MALQITPSPALCVSDHTPVSECVRKMRDQKVGSLLIMAHDQPRKMVGIFTERDLLKRIDEIQHGDHWNKPVAHLMTRSVQTLEVGNLFEAGPRMLKEGFRHLPVVHSSDKGPAELIGVISIRDVLALEIRAKEEALSLAKRAPKKGRTPRSRVIHLGQAESPGLQRLVEVAGRTLWLHRDVNPPALNSPKLFTELESADLVFLDLDGLRVMEWTELLRKLNRLPEAPPLILLLTESHHSEPERVTLKALSRSGKWPVFLKPFPVTQVLDQVRELLEISPSRS